MTPIHELLSRIRWDKEFGQGRFEIGYFDRHQGAVVRVALQEVAFPEEDIDRSERLRGQISGAARRLSALIAEEGAPLPRQLAVRVEELIGELLSELESN